MLVSFDHQIFGWQEYGGISRYFFELANGLAETPEVTPVVTAPFFVNRYLQEGDRRFRVWGMRAPVFPLCGRVYRAVNSLPVRVMNRYLQPDIVHETFFARRGVAPTRAKVILTVYDMIHERFPSPSAGLVRRERAAAVARADHVICISHQTRSDLIELLDVAPRKVSVVHLGFSLTARAIETSSVAADRPFLLYVGKRGGYKNFEGLLRAVAGSRTLRKNVRIVSFGGGPMTAQERALSADLGFDQDDVCQVSGSDGVLAGLYRQALAFVYPSKYEGFGIPPLEAMNFDCPVVCSRAASIPEVVGDAGEYFDPSDIDDMRAALERVVADEVVRLRLVSAGKNRLKLFSWGRCVSESLAVYRQVLK